MNCPICHSVNEETQKFCRSCGARLQTSCPGCGNAVAPGDRLCKACGLELENGDQTDRNQEEIASERKFITSLFADISGYTTFSERLDPEEVKDLVSQIIGEIAQVVIKYEGHIEKFAGDQVMALFGVPGAHEDDPVRAVKAAGEIHQVVSRISPKVQNTIGQPLAMHIGINTGLALTGDADFPKEAAHHIAGDTVNVASRLCTLAKAGETLVGQDTYTQAEGFFNFEPLEMVEVKGKNKPVKAYRVLSSRELPSKTHRSTGRRSTLVGRQKEMTALTQALARIQKGEAYSVVALSGEAGTGKSRLVEEFKLILDLQKITWMEGHAYAYTHNISYYPLTHLIKRDLAIEEEDSPGRVVAKLEARLAGLKVRRDDVAPYLGGLLSLQYPEVTGMSPEVWRARLHHALLLTLQAHAQQAPVVICFEDLHWADPLFLNFLRGAVLEKTPGVFLLCTFRPPLKLFTSDEIKSMGESYQEIQLQDLSAKEIQEMLSSILQTTEVPPSLRRFVQEKLGTNPFYLEEMINSLIDSGTLQPDDGYWRLTGALNESEIPPSIQAVISGRIDRLETPAKRLLQEASVIGRTAPYEILRRTSRDADHLGRLLEELAALGLLRRPFQTEQEYEFKHALIQEVVYGSLLKKDRQAMHQKIGLVMEQVFADRLPEFYETLAFHFRHSELSQKAIDYLRKAGRKSLNKYAVQESHEYYQRAFKILEQTLGNSEEENRSLIDFLNEWAQVFYYRADFNSFIQLFYRYKGLADSLSDKSVKASFYAWLGFGLFCSGKPKDSFQASVEALRLGQESGSNAAIGLAYSNLTWCCAELKLLDLGIQYGDQMLAKRDDFEPMAYFMSFGGLGLIHIFKGNSQKNFDLGRILLEYSESHSDLRSMVVGYICKSYGYQSVGDIPEAMKWSQKAIELSNDPLFSVWPKLVHATYYLYTEQFQEADEILREIIPFCQNLGMGYVADWAQALQGAVLLALGQPSRGLKILGEGVRIFTRDSRLLSLYFVEFTLAEIYFQVVTGSRRLGFWQIVKNLGFILKELPFARRKAKAYLRKVLEVGQEIGAVGFMPSHAAHLVELLQQPKGQHQPAEKGQGIAD